MDTLKDTLKAQIIEALSLEEMTPADIDDEAPLFGEGLGLDSIDALELIVLMEKDLKEGKAIFTSINSMTDYIKTHREQ